MPTVVKDADLDHQEGQLKARKHPKISKGNWYFAAFVITHTTAHNSCADIYSLSSELSIPDSAQLTALAVSMYIRREKKLKYMG